MEAPTKIRQDNKATSHAAPRAMHLGQGENSLVLSQRTFLQKLLEFLEERVVLPLPAGPSKKRRLMGAAGTRQIHHRCAALRVQPNRYRPLGPNKRE